MPNDGQRVSVFDAEARFLVPKIPFIDIGGKMLQKTRQQVFQDVKDRIAKVPRVKIACTPTPLHEARRLSAYLSGPRIFLKRDDLTGVAFGGNKTRNLEFRLARALSEKAEVIIVALDLQSNSARQTIGSCNRLGLKTILVLEGDPPSDIQGNLLVDYLLGAEIHFTKTREAQRAKMETLAEEIRKAGKIPHILNDNPMFEVASAIAYIESTMEIMEQLSQEAVEPDFFYMSSSGKGQAGLSLAKKIFNLDVAMRGVTASAEYKVAERTAEIANQTSRMLGLETTVTADEINNFGEYVGKGYGIPTPQGNEAVRIFAQTEGVILDPIYTGKCAAGMIDHIRSGHFSKDDVIVFVHTGGTPAIFTYNSLWQS
jgi:D-cysteine desulfhydrase/L-cysteate sulfo-lyase